MYSGSRSHSVLGAGLLKPRLSLSARELYFARYFWEQLASLPEIGESEGWLKKVRVELELSAKSMAERLGITQAAYSKLESAAARGTLSDRSLRRLGKVLAAKVESKRLKFCTEPREQVWQTVLETTLRLPMTHNVRWKAEAARGRSVGAIAARVYRDTRFRRQQGWAQKGRANPSRLSGRAM